MDKSVTATTSAASPEEADPATEASSHPAEAAPHLWPHLAQFFTTTAHPAKEGKLKALCLACKPKQVEVTISTISLFNIKRHFRTAHPSLCDRFNNAITLGSKRGSHNSGASKSSHEPESPGPATKRTKLPIIGNTITSHVNIPASQKKCDDLFVDMMINDMYSILSTPTMDKSLTTTTSTVSPEETDPATEASSQSAEAASHLWPHLAQFFTTTAHPAKEGMLKALCLSCKPRQVEVTISSMSLFNIKRHFRTAHPSLCARFNDAITLGSKRGRHNSGASGSSHEPESPSPAAKRTKLPIIGDTFTSYMNTPASQKKCDNLFVDMMINDMLPISFADSPHLRAYITACNPARKVMSRRSLMRRIIAKAENGKAELISLLQKVHQVATTADCWTFHNRSYLGMTVHWLDPKTLARKKGVLACRELEGSLTPELLAKEIVEIHRLFHLDNKVVSITTDNGTNFVRAFTKFGTSASLFPTEDSEPHLQDSDRESEGESEGSNEAEEENFTPVELHSRLKESTEYNIHDVGLPNHQRCVAHTMNLVVTSDLVNIPNWPSKNHYRKALSKAQELWNRQNRSTQVSKVISKELGCKFPTPTVTRWNSLYDALVALNKMLAEQRYNLDKVCEFAGITLFTGVDIEVLQEFVQVMSSVALVLDRLQSDHTAYNGVLLPTLKVLEVRLSKLKAKRLKYMEPVVDTLLQALEKRFGSLFHDDDLLLAAAFHPQFKTQCLADLNPAKASHIKSKMAEVLRKLVDDPIHSSSGSTEEDEDPFFLDLGQTSSSGGGETDSGLQKKLSKEVEIWKDQNRSAKKVNQSMFPNFQHSAWIRAFTVYNTAIPSSAAVEHVFSMSSDIMKPTKRSLLSSQNFERLVFLKGNSGVLKLAGDED